MHAESLELALVSPTVARRLKRRDLNFLDQQLRQQLDAAIAAPAVDPERVDAIAKNLLLLRRSIAQAEAAVAAEPPPAALASPAPPAAGSTAPEPDPVIEQAHRDLRNGLVDTDMRATPGLDAQRRAKLVPGPGGRPPARGRKA